MPAGRFHLLCTVGEIFIATPIVYATTHDQVLTRAFFSGAVLGLLCGPDLDVDSGNIHFFVMEWYFGKPARIAWRAFWTPYAKTVKHRSFLSHSIFGTFPRLAYIFLPIIFVLNVSHIKLPDIQTWWVAFVFGLWISDTLHVVADVYAHHFRHVLTPDVEKFIFESRKTAPKRKNNGRVRKFSCA